MTLCSRVPTNPGINHCKRWTEIGFEIAAKACLALRCFTVL